MELLRCRRGLRFKFFNWLVWGCLAQAVLAVPPAGAAGGVTGASLVNTYLSRDSSYRAAYWALGDAVQATAAYDAMAKPVWTDGAGYSMALRGVAVYMSSASSFWAENFLIATDKATSRGDAVVVLPFGGVIVDKEIALLRQLLESALIAARAREAYESLAMRSNKSPALPNTVRPPLPKKYADFSAHVRDGGSLSSYAKDAASASNLLWAGYTMAAGANSGSVQVPVTLTCTVL